MKKQVLLLAFACCSIVGTTFGSTAREKKSKAKSSADMPAKTNVWVEEKMGTYRESTIVSIFAGRCKKSTSLCMMIFHDGDNPNALHVSVNTGSGTYEFDCHSYKEKPYSDGKESGMEYSFE